MKMENTKKEIEKAAKYYAHNYFDMHETNSYQELKRGFLAGVEWKSEQLADDSRTDFEKGYTKGWCEGFNSGKQENLTNQK